MAGGTESKHGGLTLASEHTYKERYAAGRAFRDKCPRKAHAQWNTPKNRRDAVEMVRASETGRIPELLPLPHGRVVQSAFTFYRGSALIISLLWFLFIAASGLSQPSTPLAVQDIIEQSSQVTHGDWEKAPAFDFCESDRSGKGVRTYLVQMIAGSPYNRLVAVNGKNLSTEDQNKEAKKLDATIRQRQRETVEERNRRVAEYEKERQHDRLMLEELTVAMQFTWKDTETIDGRETYVLDAISKPGYTAKTTQTLVLTGMRGRLWIDQASLRWVKVEAEVIRPVMIKGILARVETGTRFELKEMPVDAAGTWLPSHFSMQSRAKVLLLFPKSSQQDETYFHYQPNGLLSPEACQQP